MSANRSMSAGEEAAQRELQKFLEEENMKLKFQQQIHLFTEMCWDKCVTGKIGTKLDRGEENCLGNCVERYLDAGQLLIKRLENMSG